MYDPVYTANQVDLISQRQGWPLTYHSQSQVDSMTAHLDNLWDPVAGRFTRPLKAEEQRWITNERRLCKLDFRGYWLTRYARILNWARESAPFTPNIAQNIVLDLWADDERNGLAIWMAQLKARRLGVSTISELNVAHRFLFQENANCVVASADPTKTLEMAGMIKFAIDHHPWWLRPQSQPKIKSGIPIEYPDIRTRLTFQAGNQFTGVAQGSTPNVIHLSELCLWEHADELIDIGLLPAILDAPNVFCILESTGQGPGWWKDKWQQIKRDAARGTGRFRHVFLPWYVGTDIYPTEADLRKRPVPPDWQPSDRTIRHAERARAYVLSNPLLFKHVAKFDRDWQMPLPQLWWHEIGYQTAHEEKKLHVFMSQYCADDIEAFQFQQNPLIDQEIIISYQERTRDPIGVYTVIGPDIPPALVTPSRYYDSSKPTITIGTRDLLPNFDVKYQLIPLVFPGYSDFDESLKLLIWEWPLAHNRYGVGVDCSEGVGLDNAVINVLREATPARECGQVAEWASNEVTAFQLWPLVMAVGCLYSTTDAFSGEKQQCRLAIETWTNGAAAQNELQKRGWHNFHPHYYAGDSKKPKNPGTVNRIGVMTNMVLRAAIQDLWLTCLKEEAIDLPSPYLVQEITTLENVEGKAQAQLGEKDDRFMSLGFPLLSLHQGKRPHEQFTRRRVSYQPGLAQDSPIAHPTWSPPAQAMSQPFVVGRQGGLRGRVEQRIHRIRDKNVLDRYRNPDIPIRYR